MFSFWEEEDEEDNDEEEEDEDEEGKNLKVLIPNLQHLFLQSAQVQLCDRCQCVQLGYLAFVKVLYVGSHSFCPSAQLEERNKLPRAHHSSK